jgi:hypothetical protein
LSAWLRNIDLLFPLLLLGAAMYLTGFVIWSKPMVKKILASWWGKWAFTILHGFLVILAIVVARTIVVSALELPPQYFDLTIGFVALIAYVPVCIAALAVFMFLFFAAMLVVAAVTGFLPNVLASLCRPLVGNARWLNRFNAKYGMFATKAFYHAVGAVVVVLVLAASLDAFGLLVKHTRSGVRWLAYATDFQPAGKYPGVPCGGRIKLQDNGVVALAQIEDKDIHISIKSFDGNANFADNCLTGKGK